MGTNWAAIGKSVGQAIQNTAQHTAKAAAMANGISAQAQSAQGAFNQASANQANMLNDQTLASQYAFNSAQAQAANEYNTEAWNRAADWNANMWQQQANYNAEQAAIAREFSAAEAQKARDFNAEQAEISRQFNSAEAKKTRDWQTQMANTAYQRAMKDMAAAGLNPILAYSNGGANVPGGATASGVAATGGSASGIAASVGGAQMSSAQSQMASGGLLGANSASVGNYQGQMEYMSGILGLISAVCNGISQAQSAMGFLGNFGMGLGEGLESILTFALGSNKKSSVYSGKEKTLSDYNKSYDSQDFHKISWMNEPSPWSKYWNDMGLKIRKKYFS